jgi:hypothetical protein
MKLLNTVLVLFTLLTVSCGGGGGGGEPTPPPAVTLDSIDVTADNTTIPAGLSESFTATGNYSDGHSEDITVAVSWSSSDDTLASVDTEGLVSGVTTGTTSIQASMDSVMGETPVTISNAVLNQITLDPQDPELAAGLSRSFSATGHYSDGAALLLTGLSWVSSDETVATITSNGRVTAVSPGVTDITATDGTVSGQTSLRVPDKQLTDITVAAQDGATAIPVSTTQTYIATGIYDDGSSADISSDVIWSSSNTAIATISAAQATGIAPGDVMISASKDSVTSASVPLTVTAATLESIDVTPTTARVLAGGTKEYQAWGNFSDGTVKEITDFNQTKWTSDDTTIARVTKGTVTGKNTGTATITVTNRGVDASFTVDVYDTDIFNITAIDLSPDNGFIRYDLSQDYSVTATFGSGPVNFAEDVTDLVEWSIADGSIASISQDGHATGLGIGNTTLTATYAGKTTSVTLHGIGKSPVLQTGQTTCYDSNNDTTNCTGTGQDGEYQSGLILANRWEEDGDCVIDHLTGLLWVKPNLLTSGDLWLAALDQLKSLNRCGYGGAYDWHMPNWNELRSLINYSQIDQGAYLIAQGFDGANVSGAWTSTTDRYNGESNAIFFSMIDGDDGYAPKTGTPEAVWAVRELDDAGSTLPETGQLVCWDVIGNPTNCYSVDGKGQDADVRAGLSWPQPRFVRDGECITDLLTGLTWVRTPDINIRDWHAALSFANSTSYCGQNGWRLPSINELQSLIHQGYPQGLVEVTTYLATAGFGVVPDVVYWSSTTYANDPSKAWVVDMSGSGSTYRQAKTGLGAIARTWLVRGRKDFQ